MRYRWAHNWIRIVMLLGILLGAGIQPISTHAQQSNDPPDWSIPQAGVTPGTLHDWQVMYSENLHYDVAFQIYTPAGYDELDHLPTFYATDGAWYAGVLPVILDNLIATHQIKPLIVVFIDARNPSSPEQNRRSYELTGNERFAAFLALELVPVIDAAYHTEPQPAARGIMGISLGGFNAAFVGYHYPEVFGWIGMLSPVFIRSEAGLIDAFATDDPLPLQFFVSIGNRGEDRRHVQRLVDVLTAYAYPLRFVEVDAAHNEDNWRNLLDDLLIYFLGI